MTIALLLKIAAVGLVISVVNQILKHAGRDDQATIVTLAGMILVILWIIPYILELFETLQSLFSL